MSIDSFDWTYSCSYYSIPNGVDPMDDPPLKVRINRSGILPPGDWTFMCLSLPVVPYRKEASDDLWVGLDWKNVTMRTRLEYIGIEVSTRKKLRSHTFWMKDSFGFPRSKSGRLTHYFSKSEIEGEGEVRFRIHAKARKRSPTPPPPTPSSSSVAPPKKSQKKDPLYGPFVPDKEILKLITRKGVNDVRLYFPESNKDLWTTTERLSVASSVLSDHISTLQIPSTSALPTSARERNTASDSDAESATSATDEDFSLNKWPNIHQINITNASYITWKALLYYLLTGQIDFALPISSFVVYPSSQSTYADARIARRYTFLNTLSLIPSSPKSMHRLSTFLKIPHLQTLSLLAYKTSLKASNATVELVRCSHAGNDVLQGIVMGYAKKHWEKVRKTQGFKDTIRRVKSGLVRGSEGEWTTEGVERLFELLVAR